MRGTAAALALALAAAGPAAAGITADDLWQGWGAALARAGAVQTGTPEREGPVVTVTGAGAAIELPAARIGWEIDRLILTEQGDGSLRLSFPRAVPVRVALALDLPWHHAALTLAGELTAEDLDWRYAGTPDDLRGSLTARRLTLEMTGTGDAAFAVAEDVERSSRIRTGDAPLAGGEARIGHLVTDISTGSEGRLQRRVADYRELAASFELRLPGTAPDVPSLSAMLRAGARLHARGGAEAMEIRRTRHDRGEIRREAVQSLRDADWSLVLTRGRGLELGLGNGGFTLAQQGGTRAQGESAHLRLRLPLIAGRAAQEAALELGFDGLAMPGVTGDGPAHLDIALRAGLVLTGDLADGTRHPDPAALPLELLRFEIERLDFAGAGTTLSGTGELFWPEGSRPGPDLPAPEGELVLTAGGAHAALGRLEAEGLLPPAAAWTLRAAIAAFGRPVGAGRIEARLGFGPDGLRVNGLPLPF